jgi:hypothetical protein
MKPKIEISEEMKLRWPDGIERTRIKDRVKQARWKQTWKDAKDALAVELGRLDATSILVTRAEDQRTDPGVAVWFSRVKEDFGWEQGLGLGPAPTVDQIDSAFRERARKAHPDSPGGGDPALFKQLSDWRAAAKAWIAGTHAHSHEFVMAIDQYDEPRLNLKAIQMAFLYIRRLEDVGAPTIVSQTLGAFRAKLTGGSNGPVAA